MSVSGGEGFSIIINKVKVIGNYVNTIHDSIQGQALMKYWTEQGWFPADQHNNIDWDVVKHARAKLPFDRKIWMIKQVSGFCGTGVKMKLRDFRDVDVCPLCHEPENNIHVVKYGSDSTNAAWQVSLENLEDLLLNNHTPPSTTSMLITKLRSWRGGGGVRRNHQLKYLIHYTQPYQRRI